MYLIVYQKNRWIGFLSLFAIKKKKKSNLHFQNLQKLSTHFSRLTVKKFGIYRIKPTFE